MDEIKKSNENRMAANAAEKVLTSLPLFLCNENPELPSVAGMGGDWDLIMRLIESRRIFYSKIYKNRVTYLSSDLYWAVKPYKQRWSKLSERSQNIFKFVDDFGEITTSEIKNIFQISNKQFTQCINELSKELFITAVSKEKKINHNWSSFYWGSYQLWEETAEKPVDGAIDILEVLSSYLSEKEIKKIFR